MNQGRRKRITGLRGQLSGIRDKVDVLHEEEREAFGNMPEPLQSSERGEASGSSADALEAALSALDDASDQLDQAAEG